MTIQKLSLIFYLVTGILISLLTLFIGLRLFEQREHKTFTGGALCFVSCGRRAAPVIR